MRENAAQGGLMNAKRGLVDGPGGYAGESQQNKFNFDDTFSLWERLNPRDPENELIAEHMQIGKLPFNITERIFELNRGGKSYEDIAEITGVDIEDITSMLEVANNPDSIDPVDRQGKVDYNLFEEIVKERDQIRERPEHLSYNAQGGRIGYDMGGDVSDRAKLYYKYIQEMKSMGLEPVSVEEFNKMLDAMREKNAQGGRIGYRFGPGPVMTADAVIAAGGGSINKGAQLMYDTMKHLEAQPTAKRMTA